MEAVVIPDADLTRGRYKRERQSEHQFSQQFQQNQHGGFYSSVNPNHIDVQPIANSSQKSTPSGLGLFVESLRSLGEKRRIDGHSPVHHADNGNEEVFHFDENVDSLQVLIETNGLSCQARIEVTYDHEDDETIQQVIELSIEDGKERPFFAVIDTPLACPSTVRVVNLDPYSAFPLMAYVEPYTIGSGGSEKDEDFEFKGVKTGEEEEKNTNLEDEREEEHYSFPDITIPLTDINYEFEEEFFFAKRE